MRSLIVAGTLALAAAGPLVAQAHSHDHTSPYAGYMDRDIKALSAEETAALLNGEGAALALAAELNHYPGPRHVLDLRTELGLSSDQDAAIHTVFDEMQAETRSLGRIVVDLERDLDRAFAAGTITDVRLTELVEAIALARGKVRAAHLRAHLRVAPILTAAQREAYARARGYTP